MTRVRSFLGQHGDAVLSALFLLLVVALYVQTLGVHYYKRPGENVGPFTWPRALIALTVVFALADIAIHLAGRRRPAADPDEHVEHVEDEGAAIEDTRAADLGRLGLAVLLTAGYVVAAIVLGFLVGTFVFLIVFMLTGGFRRWPVALAVAAIGSYALTFVFEKVVYVTLPLGVGPFVDISSTLYSVLGIF